MNLVSIERRKVTSVGKSVIFVRCMCPMCESRPYCIYLHGSLSHLMAARIIQIHWVVCLTPEAKVGRWKDYTVFSVWFFVGDGFMRKETIFYAKDNVGLILRFILLPNVFQVLSLFSYYSKHLNLRRLWSPFSKTRFPSVFI